LRHRLAAPAAASRTLRSGALCASVVATVLAATLLATPVTGAAAPSTDSASALRAQADELASRYFDALSKSQALDAEINHNKEQVKALTARAKKARADARDRAVIAYRTSALQLPALIDGANSIDASRRALLIDRVNANDAATYDKLHAATEDLHRQQKTLEDNRRTQTAVLASLKEQGAAVEAKLAEANREAAATAAAAAAATTTTVVDAAPATDAVVESTTTTSTTTPPAGSSSPTDYTGTSGTSPHHDDPFLACVRKHETGGNYGAVNSAGPYLGAYQFLQSTWNLSASHAGLDSLVDVPANKATPYDQDEVAWALYQWQGAKPWTGSGCS
jgi:peptidoglycan hydrolase CwlO-like protein